MLSGLVTWVSEHVMLATTIVGLGVAVAMWFVKSTNSSGQGVKQKSATVKKSTAVPEKRDYSLEELAQYTGEDGKPILMAIQGVIYDITASAHIYGPSGAYAMFAGKECSRALAKMSYGDDDLNDNLEGLDQGALLRLEEW
eukprot:CAMPEP_0114539312 /NCGR_PEP_ID=MMETSP0114-20121206/171_1 /TAXON_ID=31324 /ORGANISM="Goniomonas sp, Strain m" /LENGTH=140 /DNA_ID=CAMNT_0001723407 /DNA_START=48 /DNA_END=467 /DNA_ORIENTATION=-